MRKIRRNVVLKIAVLKDACALRVLEIFAVTMVYRFYTICKYFIMIYFSKDPNRLSGSSIEQVTMMLLYLIVFFVIIIYCEM